MTKTRRSLSVTEAARNFADVVNRAFYRHETTVLLRGGVPVAHIAPLAPDGIPASELARRWPLLPRLTPEDAADWGREHEKLRRELSLPDSPWES